MLSRVIATVECRMGSSRLPGKVLMQAGGKTMLEILLERLMRATALDSVVVATTTNAIDDVIETLCARIGVDCFRGSEHDVLGRVLLAARSVDGDVLVEITGDCPFVDPDLVNDAVALYQSQKCDYVSNLDPVCFPVGFDVQVFSVELLSLANSEATLPEDREHVSWFIRRQPGRFLKVHMPAPEELHWPELCLTLDEHSDYELLKLVYESLVVSSPFFTCLDVVRFLRNRAHLLEINANVIRR